MGSVINENQPTTARGFNILPKGIPNLIHSSVPASLILHPKQLPIRPAMIEIRIGNTAKNAIKA
ncbi:MAG: hypothetical protein QM535_08280 [Limnohabitans sp.]|nr:hypothetical protein [Limnohabitans sp.]